MAAKGKRRVLGIIAFVVGGLVILIGASPIFPVIIEAFVIGGLCIAVGFWALSGPDMRASMRKAASEAGRQPRRPAPPQRVAIDPLLPVRILKLARERGGILSVSDTAIELNIPLEQAERGLSECARAGNATPDYDITRGFALYRFPEFLPPDADATEKLDR